VVINPLKARDPDDNCMDQNVFEIQRLIDEYQLISEQRYGDGAGDEEINRNQAG
jgi:hypothetical protein